MGLSRVPRKWILCMVFSVVVSIVFSSLIFSHAESEFQISVSYKSEGKERSAEAPLVTYFLLDGFNFNVFTEQLEAGNLPNMQRMINTGGWIKQGITTFPSVTAYGFFPMLAGESGPKSEVYGLRWFDRSKSKNNFRTYIGTGFKDMNIDLSDDYKLLFEEFNGAYTFSANTYMNRGVQSDWKTPWFMATAKYGPSKWYFHLAKIFGSYGFRDWKGFESNVMYGLLEDAIKNRPKVQWVTLASPDGSHHVSGTDDEYIEIVKHCDYLIGEFMDFTEMEGSLKDRLLIVTSDHGVVDVHNNLDMIRVFKDFGLSAFEPPSMSIAPIHFDTDVSWYSKQKFDAFIGINGNTMIYVYLSRPDMRSESPGVEWQHRLLPEQIVSYKARSGVVVNLYDELKCGVGIEFIMGLSADSSSRFTRTDDDTVIVIYDCYSSALVHRHENKWSYVVRTSETGHSDPFGYLSDPDVSYYIKQAVQDGKYLTRREWMEGTKDGQYPLGPVLAEEILSMPQSGDLILTSKYDYDFGKDYEWFVGNNRGGHGGIHRNQTVVPIIMNGWGITPATSVDVGTTSDMGATIRHITGLPDLTHAAGRVWNEIVDEERIQSHNSMLRNKL